MIIMNELYPNNILINLYRQIWIVIDRNEFIYKINQLLYSLSLFFFIHSTSISWTNTHLYIQGYCILYSQLATNRFINLTLKCVVLLTKSKPIDNDGVTQSLLSFLLTILSPFNNECLNPFLLIPAYTKEIF